MLKVTGVRNGSIADELGIVRGTALLSINGRPLEDFLDWEFLSAEEELLLRVRQPDGEEIEFDIERTLSDPLGVTVEPPRIRRCANRCDFCFVDGLPEGLREVLYIRDDDYRLSFRYGNFATLTNLKPRDVERIIEYRLSPLYVSVHATDPAVRRRLLRNPLAPDVLEQLRYFAAHGIRFHAQIVLQPGVNDGPLLDRSLGDLYALADPVLSVSVVPVGLTEFSQHARVREPTREECLQAAGQLERWQRRARRERGFLWVHGADELYLRAGRELPPEENYGEFEQVENGVGSVRFLQRRIREASAGFGEWKGLRIGVITGSSMGALMPQVLETLTGASGARFELIVVTNRLFGPRVTTAGLLDGGAIAAALEGRSGLDFVLLPGEALNDEGLFIDGMSADQLRARAGVELRFSRYFSDALEAGIAA